MITYPRTEGRHIEAASARTAPEVGKDAFVLSPAVAAILLPLADDRSRPEPGAVPGREPVEWRPKPVPFVPEGWVDPDAAEPGLPDDCKPTCAFLEPPVPVVLPPGVTVYRIIGAAPDGRLANPVAGCWWMLSPPPETEAEWRAKFAVCGHWNGDGGYIAVTLKKEVRAWQGVVAPHRSMADGYFLPGGGVQIWVPRGAIDPIRDGMRLEDILRPTPWREKELLQEVEREVAAG